MNRFEYDFSFKNKTSFLTGALLDRFRESAGLLPLKTVLGSSELSAELAISFAFGSSRIEGTVLSLMETKTLLTNQGNFPHYKYEDDEKKAADRRIVINNKRAFSLVLRSSRCTPAEVDRLQSEVIELLDEPGVRDEKSKVYVPTPGGFYYPLAADSARIVKEMEKIVTIAQLIKEPFNKSFYLLLNLSYLQAYRDGNKRTARVVSALPLFEAGLCPLTYEEVGKQLYDTHVSRFYETGTVDEKFFYLLADSYDQTMKRLAALARVENRMNKDKV
ncbi:MAG: Fic family protein [Campylobacterales bacterium]